MKKELNLIILLCCLFLNGGCKMVLKKIYGVKTADFQSQESIVKFHNDIGFGNISYFSLKADSWKNNKLLSLPDVFVFSSTGNYIPYRDSLKPNCNGPADVFLSELHPEKKYIYSDDYNLKTFLHLLEGPECQPLEFDSVAKVDFYIFFTTATFVGKKIFREKSAIWLDSLEQNRNVMYQLFILNEDWKSCWSDTNKQLFTTDE